MLSIALAFLSWRYVEQPFRNKGVFSRKVIFLFSVGGSIFLIVIGLVGYLTNGFENRAVNKIPSQIIDRKLAFNHGLNVACDTGEFTLDPLCRTDGNPDILVWGDSFAMHLVKGIMASNPNAKIIQLTKFTCGPFFDIAPIHEPKYPPSWAQGCLDFSRSVHEWLKKQTTIKYAVLASPYYNYLLKDGKILTRDGDIFPGSDGSVLLDKAFENTINELRQMGITPVVFSPPPLNGDDIGRCLAKSIWQGGDLEDCDFSVNEVPEGFTEVRRILKKVEKYNPVIFLDDFICRDAICTTHHDNTFLYRDEAHLSCEGSVTLGKKFKFYDLIVNQ
ncbi:MAG TPA: hypothetical protein ENK75_03090 [Saprospiraceae bacterium]|nr:hypothetical protein [Saprospiraceae bacterium]